MLSTIRRSTSESHNSLTKTPVQHQEDCPFCWAIAPADSSTLFMQHHGLIGRNVRLAPNILLDCCDPVNRESTKCQYYQSAKAFQYILDFGLPDMQHVPFRVTKHVCEKERPTEGRRYKIPHWRSISIEEGELKNAFESSLFVVLVLSVDDSFDAYKNTQVQEIWAGPVEPEYASYMHAVVAYGWDQDPQTGQYYWLIKNSYGRAWGHQGYGKILFRSCMPGGSRPYIYYAYCPCF